MQESECLQDVSSVPAEQRGVAALHGEVWIGNLGEDEACWALEVEDESLEQHYLVVIVFGSYDWLVAGEGFLDEL